MTPIDERNEDQYTITLTSNKLLMTICGLLVVMLLCVMLGIRIERYQQVSEEKLRARIDPETHYPYLPAPAATRAQQPASTIDDVPSLSELQVAKAGPTESTIPTPGRAELPVMTPVAQTATPTPAEDPIPKLLEQASAPDAAAQLPAPTQTPAPVVANPIGAAPTPRPVVAGGRRLQFDSPSAPAGPIAAPAPMAGRVGNSTARYVVQVLSSQDRNQADQRARLLTGQGIPAFVEQAMVNGQPWYRVLAGTFDSKPEALGAMAQLKRDPRFSSSYIRAY